MRRAVKLSSNLKVCYYLRTPTYVGFLYTTLKEEGDTMATQIYRIEKMVQGGPIQPRASRQTVRHGNKQGEDPASRK
jgi:hypothetical protein